MVIESPASKLVGIAKLAESSELLEAKRTVQYFELPTRRFIGRCSGTRMPFEWTINPYRGCEFGCKYCYARFAHEFMELRESNQFEEMIYAKQWNQYSFKQELNKIPHGEAICLGTATDPYQPAERRFGITRKMLRVLATDRGHRIWITTKSDLVARDLDLLQEISRANMLQVSMTVTTVDEALARLLEPRAPCPHLRLAAVKKLAQGGIRVGVLANPVMPLLTDSEKSLDALAEAVAETGAHYFSGAVLFLKPCAQQVFLPFLEGHFPRLLRRYRERFERSAYLKGDYPQMIAKRFESVRARHGLKQRVADYQPALWEGEAQMNLFD